MKGVSPIFATVMLIVVVVALISIFITFSTQLLKNTQTTVENRTSASIECSAAQISIDDVFVKTGTIGTQIKVINNGLKDGLTIVSGTIYLTNGSSYIASNVPLAGVDVGIPVTLTFPAGIANCSDFARAVVTTNCGIATDVYTKTPRCA